MEQHLATLKENEAALNTLQDSLALLDQTLTSYLTDRIDAFQIPQEAQVYYTHTQAPASSLDTALFITHLISDLGSQAIQTDIAAHEASLEDLRRRNAGNGPAPTSDGKSSRGGTMLDHLQVRII